jgi:sugar (pentulose or hexulose) kinase
MAYFLGIDLGTSAVKCILVDEAGKVKSNESVEYPLLQPILAGRSRIQRIGGMVLSLAYKVYFKSQLFLEMKL